MSEFKVMYRKYDGSLHWNFSGQVLGEDQHGRWVGCRPGTVASRGGHVQVLSVEPSVLLFPYGAWWTAMFYAPPHDMLVYCDITSVPEWHDAMVTMIDLDLDVIRYRDGRLVLDDEDEFATHQVRYGYPQDVIETAQETATSLMTRVAAGTEPFGGAHERWLAELG